MYQPSDGEQPAAHVFNAVQGVGGRATWGFKDVAFAVIGVLATLFVILLIGEAVIAAVDAAEESATSNTIRAFATGAWEASIVAVVLLLARLSGGGPRNLGLVQPDGTGDTERWSAGRLAGLILVAYLVATIMVVAYQVIVDALGLDALLPDEQIPDTYFDSNVTVIVLAISTTILAPIGEELLFRGFLFAGLRRYMPLIPAALLSGLCFSMAHAQLGLIIPFAGVGMLFAFVYERTRTIYASIGVHFVFNAISTAVLIISQRS